LRLKENPKLVDRIRRLSPTPLKLVAFKLTRGADPAEASAVSRALLASSGADWVVHNDLAARSEGNGAFPADIYQADGSVASHCPDRAELAAALERLLVNEAATAWTTDGRETVPPTDSPFARNEEPI
jgi:phosphopantothenoylcysteine synthetase/decarboxylase